MLLLYRVFATLAEMNKAKSVVLPYMEVKFCTQWEHGYVIVLIMCLCGHICCKDSAKLCMHLYLNCIQNKNSTQSLFRDISLHCCWCCKEALLPSKVLWRHGMCWSAVSLQLSVHNKYQWPIAQCGCAVAIDSLLYNTLELQVRMEFGVVTKVSKVLVITQVSIGLKK